MRSMEISANIILQNLSQYNLTSCFLSGTGKIVNFL
ncbi:MAG: hypothetical protein NC078_11245 [Ruminococcus sp.]|nr:hypothetical protein [Ruminococcus sp.]